MIANHYSHKLSKLDLLMASFVPPGGNWKAIPQDVPSQRLTQIRESYAAGKGSRSTYYGRLRHDRPAYTINTHFNRPGNGCFLHYDFSGKQHRTISQREAARLQTFPDRFSFSGSKQSINKQIGNAVPPLLALQLALAFSEEGAFIDLFSGAGGLSLGFEMAGWRQLVANDIEESFLGTYRQNLGGAVVHGDIAHPGVLQEVISTALARRRSAGSGPLVVLGGPPCQGFSTAGNRRSMQDLRNHLFKQYTRVLHQLDADAFVFENVPGLLNMQGGAVFQAVLEALHSGRYETRTWLLAADQFTIPQRRTRIFVVGIKGNLEVARPKPLTNFELGPSLLPSMRRCWSVSDALSDLPPVAAGQDGSALDYLRAPENLFQAFARGQIGGLQYLREFQRAVAA
jgi:DNA (cytosine-5)-methyltransferase 1